MQQNRLQLELHTLGLEATGNKPTLVNRLHAALAEQQPMQVGCTECTNFRPTTAPISRCMTQPCASHISSFCIQC